MQSRILAIGNDFTISEELGLMNRLMIGLVAGTIALGASARSFAKQEVKAKASLKIDWQTPNYKREADRHEVRTEKREVKEVYVRVDREECDEHCRKHHKHKHWRKEFHDNRSEQGEIHGRGPE